LDCQLAGWQLCGDILGHVILGCSKEKMQNVHGILCVCVTSWEHHQEMALDLTYNDDFSLFLLDMHQPMKNLTKPNLSRKCLGEIGVRSKRRDEPDQSRIYSNQRKTLTEINLCRGMLRGKTVEEDSGLDWVQSCCTE